MCSVARRSPWPQRHGRDTERRTTGSAARRCVGGEERAGAIGETQQRTRDDEREEREGDLEQEPGHERPRALRREQGRLVTEQKLGVLLQDEHERGEARERKRRDGAARRASRACGPSGERRDERGGGERYDRCKRLAADALEELARSTRGGPDEQVRRDMARLRPCEREGEGH